MKRFLNLALLLTLTAPVSLLWGNVTAPLGAIESDQTLSVSWETYTDCSFDIVAAQTGSVVASVSILYNGFWMPSNPFYGSSGGSDWEGVSVVVTGSGAQISGLPAGDYVLQTYTRTPSINQQIGATSTYEEIDDPYYGYNYLGCFFSVE